MNKWTLSIIFITIVGIFLRLYNINAKEFWYDEAFTARMITNNFDQIILLSAKDVHPPLYYLTTKVWTMFFGTSDIGIRSFSVLFGVLLIPLTYYLTYLITKNKLQAILVSSVIAVNPFLITYSREARSYSMFAFIFALLIVTVFRIRKTGKGWVLLSILLSAFFLTHYVSIFSIPVLIWLLPRTKKLLISLVPLTLSIMLLMPAILMVRKPAEWMPLVTSIRVTESIQAFMFGVYNDNSAVLLPNIKISLVFISLLILIVLYTLDRKKNYYELLVLGVAPIVLVILAEVVGKNLYLERYIIPYGYTLIVSAGIGISRLPKQYSIPALLSYFTLSIFLTLLYTPQNLGYKNVAKYIDSLDSVIMLDATDYIAVSRYTDKVMLQDGNWSGWVVIHDRELLVLENSKPFYLASRGEVEGWDFDLSKEGFYFYEWR